MAKNLDFRFTVARRTHEVAAAVEREGLRKKRVAFCVTKRGVRRTASGDANTAQMLAVDIIDLAQKHNTAVKHRQSHRKNRYLHAAVVVGVTHEHLARFANGQVGRLVQLSWQVSLAAPGLRFRRPPLRNGLRYVGECSQELVFRREHSNATRVAIKHQHLVSAGNRYSNRDALVTTECVETAQKLAPSVANEHFRVVGSESIQN